MGIYGIEPRLERAKELIAKGDDDSFRYACLELRFCLEIVAYRNREQYGDEFPGSMAGEWKPDHIVRTLASFDPLTAQAGKLSIGVYKPGEDEPTEFLDLGQTGAIPWRSFRKYYNTLGSYLHMPSPVKTAKPRKPLTKDTFTQILDDLDMVAAASIVLAVKHVRSAACKCGNTLYVGESEFDSPDWVICGNSKCNLPWYKRLNEAGERVLSPVEIISFKCKCDALLHVPQDRVWAPFRCNNCNTLQKLVLTAVEHFS